MRPRAIVLGALAALVLAAPAALAFFSGGYFDEPRIVAAIVAWAAVVAVALAAPSPLPRTLPGRLAVGGLAALTALTVASISWTPIHGPAIDDAQRLSLYLADLLVAAAVLRGAARRVAEPALLAGIVVVVGYGLSERVVPGVIELSRSTSAAGRLEQPLTYWNATGALAAIGIVLGARLWAASGRPGWLRMAAAATVPLLGVGLVLTFSRGAIAAALAGLVLLALLAPERTQRLAALGAGILAALAGTAAALLPAVRTLEGAHRAAEGVALLAVLVVLGAAAALLARRERPERATTAPARTGLARAAAIVAAVLALVALAAALERGPEQRTGASAQRLASTESNRYEYWRVAVDVFGEHPLAGHGSGSFQVDWLHDRTIGEVVRDAHSLYLETAAELGVAGLLLLGLFLGGVVWAAVLAHRRSPAAAAGPAAALAVWLIHAGLDWDWEMPALTLVAIALMGLLIALADEAGEEPA